MMKNRELTVQETEDRFFVQQFGTSSKPGIRLRGKWLHDAGFRAGDKVEVEVEEEKLIIRRKTR